MVFRIETSKGAYAASQPEYIENHPCGGVYTYDCCRTYHRTRFETLEIAQKFIEKCKKWSEEKGSGAGRPDFSTWKIVEMDA